jgi:hypothetical protein
MISQGCTPYFCASAEVQYTAISQSLAGLQDGILEILESLLE